MDNRPWTVDIENTLKRTFLGSFALMVLACDSTSNHRRQHEAECRSVARLIVHNPELWDQYRHGAKKQYLTRISRSGHDDRQLPLEYVPGFEQRYGEGRTRLREGTDGSMQRSDVSVIHGSNLVATLTDVIATFDGFATDESVSCVTDHPNLYSGLFLEEEI